MHIYIPIHRYTYIHTQTHVYRHVYTHSYLYTHIYTDIYTHIHVHIHANIYTNIYTYTRIYTHKTHKHPHIYIHIHAYAYTYLLTHSYTHVHTRTYINTYTHIAIYIYIYIHTHIYIYIYTRFSKKTLHHFLGQHFWQFLLKTHKFSPKLIKHINVYFILSFSILEYAAFSHPRLSSVWYFFKLICEGSVSSFFQLELIHSSRESLPLWILLPETCYSVFGKSLTTDLICAVSQAVHLLNTYEIRPTINLWFLAPKLFDFIELDSVVFKIIAFKMMSNFGGQPVYTIR